MSRRVLFVTPEIAPLNKVGGLGDVGHGLVQALRREGWDVRVLLPAYPDVKRKCRHLMPLAGLTDRHGGEGRLLEARAHGLEAPLYLADFPHHFDKGGSPYGNWGEETPADARGFAAFAQAAVRLAQGVVEQWRPEVIHCNDWTTGMVPALLHDSRDRPGTVFTVHNLAHQGLFPRSSFDELGLPEHMWALDGFEFHGRMSFIKGGLVFADRVNTVSPTYAREVLTPQFGCGLEGLLSHRRRRLSGILNGIDLDTWDPAEDTALPCRYSVQNPAGKASCKAALQAEAGLEADPAAPLIGIVSRLTHQKGIDLVMDVWNALLARGARLMVLGSGDPALEAGLYALAAANPRHGAVQIGYDEDLAHRIIGGADLLLMPSRFEPCGLTQLYALRYGTVPVGARTGGLADTIVHADGSTLASGRATGFLCQPDNSASLLDVTAAALRHFQGNRWRQLQAAGMVADFGWPPSARRYGALYEQALSDRATDEA